MLNKMLTLLITITNVIFYTFTFLWTENILTFDLNESLASFFNYTQQQHS